MGSRKKYVALNNNPADMPVLFINIMYTFVSRGFSGISAEAWRHGALYVKHGLLPFVEQLYDYIVRYNEPYASYTVSAEAEFD